MQDGPSPEREWRRKEFSHDSTCSKLIPGTPLLLTLLWLHTFAREHDLHGMQRCEDDTTQTQEVRKAMGPKEKYGFELVWGFLDELIASARACEKSRSHGIVSREGHPFLSPQAKGSSSKPDEVDRVNETVAITQPGCSCA